MEKLPPLTSPYTGGGHATLKHCGGFLRLFLPLSKGELEGVNLKSSIINLKFQRSVCLLQINLTQPSLNLSINQLRICRQPSRLCFQHVQHGNRSLLKTQILELQIFLRPFQILTGHRQLLRHLLHLEFRLAHL